MSYLLGIDLGTTFTSAAVCRRERGGWGPAEVVALGNRTAAVGSVVYVDASGELLFGEPAERRVVTDPTRVAREFKRRIGDDTPLLVGDTPMHAHELAARFARWVTDAVTAREGGAPEAIAVTHPAGWGRHRTSLLAGALREAGLAEVTLLSEPHAAAVCYAGNGRLPLGSTIAVYDLGGGTFDVTVLRMAGPGEFELLGAPVGHDRLGGLDFDELIFDNLVEHHPEAFADVDPADPAQLGALALLRRECTEAKENLSADTETVIPIVLTGRPVRARLVRSEFETMIRPAIEETLALLREAVLSASASTAELSAIVLVGGSARIPLITEMLSAALDRPIAVDLDPNAAVALGAVLTLRAEAPRTALVPAGSALPVPAGTRAAVAVPVAAGATAVIPAVPATAPTRPSDGYEPLVLPAPEPKRLVTRRGRRLAIVGGLTAAALVVGTIAAVPGHLAGVLSPAHADSATVTNDSGNGGGGGAGKTGKTGKPGHDGTTSTAATGAPGGGADAAGPLTGSQPGSPATAGNPAGTQNNNTPTAGGTDGTDGAGGSGSGDTGAPSGGGGGDTGTPDPGTPANPDPGTDANPPPDTGTGDGGTDNPPPSGDAPPADGSGSSPTQQPDPATADPSAAP